MTTERAVDRASVTHRVKRLSWHDVALRYGLSHLEALRDIPGAKIMPWPEQAPITYFGPDRARPGFQLLLFGAPPRQERWQPAALDTALRQLRVRDINAEDAEGRGALREPLRATALLAEAPGFTAVADSLDARS
jgi:hypothetical protein